ncbi:MAG: gliding motility protein GldN, partial [Bacteroidales bacterium]
MKKILVFFGLLIFLVGAISQKTQAQKPDGVLPVDGAFERTDIFKRKPTPLPYVREADVMWSKKIWRIIDLREKMNQPLYFPTTQTEGKNNLVNLLMAGIKDGTITAYDAKNDDEFKTPISYDQVKEAFGATAKKKQIRDVDTGELRDTIINADFRTEEIKQIMIKEEWYFDKQTSTLNVRIIGISPIREYYR